VTEPATLEPSAAGYGLRELVRYFLYLGAAGFGGPVALVEYMHRDLVERRGWITEDEYREGLALANLSRPPRRPTRDISGLRPLPVHRLLRKVSQPYRGYPGYPGYPGYRPCPAGYKGRRFWHQ
jgi:hypothetical protein